MALPRLVELCVRLGCRGLLCLVNFLLPEEKTKLATIA